MTDTIQNNRVVLATTTLSIPVVHEKICFANSFLRLLSSDVRKKKIIIAYDRHNESLKFHTSYDMTRELQYIFRKISLYVMLY